MSAHEGRTRDLVLAIALAHVGEVDKAMGQSKDYQDGAGSMGTVVLDAAERQLLLDSDIQKAVDAISMAGLDETARASRNLRTEAGRDFWDGSFSVATATLDAMRKFRVAK